MNVWSETYDVDVEWWRDKWHSNEVWMDIWIDDVVVVVICIECLDVMSCWQWYMLSWNDVDAIDDVDWWCEHDDNMIELNDCVMLCVMMYEHWLNNVEYFICVMMWCE